LEALNLDTLQLRASVDLIRALGGGWEDSARAQNSNAMDPQKPGQSNTVAAVVKAGTREH
jgi:hypothetical protein